MRRHTAVRLPPVRTDDWDWRLRASCRGCDPDLFFYPENERGPSRRRRTMLAKAVCAECPVQPACLAWAIDTNEPYGLWGGLTTEERDQFVQGLGPHVA